jgi:hypothetical protein
MAPPLASAADTSLGLINNEGDLVVKSDLSQSLVEVRSSHVILESGDWLNNDGSDILLLVSSVLDDLTNLLKAAVLLSAVLMLMLNQRVFHLREGSAWPVESGHTLEVHSLITA